MLNQSFLVFGAFLIAVAGALPATGHAGLGIGTYQVLADTVCVDQPGEQVFSNPERSPSLIGGLESLLQRVVYPESAIRAGIEGRVFVRFVVDTAGVPDNFEVIRSLCDECDEAAINAIRESRFEPAQNRGVPIAECFTIPINFRLTDD